MALLQIKQELIFHNIRLYPYESEEDDEQEQALNESIRVSEVDRQMDAETERYIIGLF